MKKTSHAWSVLKDYARATAKYPWLFMGVVVGVLSAVALNIVSPLFLREFIDHVASATAGVGSPAPILQVLGFYSFALFCTWIAYRVQMLTVTRIQAKVAADLYNRAFSYLVGHGHDFFINNFAGTLTRRVSRYSHAYQQVFYSIVESIFPTLLFAVGVIAVLFMENALLGAGLLAWTVFFIALQYVMTKWRYHFKLLRTAQDSRLTGALSDTVGNHAAVTFFASETQERQRLASIVKDWYRATVTSWNSDVFSYGVQGFLTRAAQIGLLFAGFYLWWNGYITVGTVVLIQIYILSLMDQITNIGGNLRVLYDAFAEAHEMIEIIEEPHAIQDVDGAGELAIGTGAVSFNKVGFEFDSKSEVLSNFNLDIKPGQRVALVGPSGAGKTTITKLLLRLHDVTSGGITIDGTDIQTVTQQSLRRAIAFVPQESTLFHRSLKENIAYGKPDATDEEIIAAAKKAHCHEFISKLAEGYDTHVGERGVKLSGGERQRVAIARAILKNAPILVLDEATSALDSESEALIQDALKTLMEGKTVIVIAHRLSTIMKMDRIIVIEDGKIAADGTHDDLLKQEGGLYHKLWSIQAGSFLAE
jgi:ATP-binding cassette, subfamily B, bacterial